MRKKVLVILPNNLGDVIMAAPVLEDLKLQDPAMHAAFFVEDGYEGGMIRNPFCDALFRFKRNGIRDLSRSADWPMAVRRLSENVAELKRERFDRVVNLSQHSYIPYIVSLLSCPDTVGGEYLRAGNLALKDTWSQYLYAIPFARRYNNLHATDIYRRIAGAGRNHPPAMMTVTEEERGNTAKKIAEHGWKLHEKPIFIFQPGAAFAAKRWPLEHFVALGKRIINDGYGVIVTGAPQEAAIAAELAAQLGTGSFAVAGILSFRETIALLPSAEACVSGDTAIMHAAAALKRKVFALFGPTNPVETGPYSEGNVVLCGRCAKRPCFCFDCKTKLCMKSILPDDVYSCIRNNGTVVTVNCDIYTTSFDEHGTFSLTPVVEAGPAFYSKSGSMITRIFAEPEYRPVAVANDADRESLLQETGIFLKVLDEMALSLSLFSGTRDKNAIHRFEEQRAKLEGLQEIGAFWTALLNLRLNGVPMLDPFAAVNESLQICTGTGNQVKHAIRVLQ